MRSLSKSLTIVFLLPCTQAAVVNYEISGYVDPEATPGVGGAIFNTSTDVPGSGTSANFVSSTAGSFVDFTVADLDNPGAGTVAHLRVTVPQLATTNMDLMLARTSNSQGLADTGTISFLLTTSSSSEPSATLRFEWFETDGVTPHPNQYTITSFDIDFQQFNEFRSAELDTGFLSNTVGSVPSNLTETTNGAYTRFSDVGNTDSGFADAEIAVSFRTTDSSVQEIRVGKLSGSGPQLYMFEFTNPPGNVGIAIPEPSALSLLLLGGLLGARRRR